MIRLKRSMHQSTIWHRNDPSGLTAWSLCYSAGLNHDESDGVISNEEVGREIAARLLGVYDASVDGIIIIDEHGKIESLNRAIERLFGYSLTDLIGQNEKC